MANTDWSLNDTVQPQDMNAIGEEINQLREDVENIEIPPASVTEAGIVKLSNATNSTIETLAATPRAVKSAYDAATAAQTTANAANTAAATAQARADSAFQLGNERKAEVVAALVAKGISASTSESWDTLITKLNSIVKATGNAVAAQLLEGYTASNASGPITGLMPHLKGARAPLGVAKWPNGDLAVYNSLGFQDGGAGNGELRVTAALMQTVEPLLNGQNIAKDATIFGIQGLLERMTTAEKQAIADAITAKGVPASLSDSNSVLAQKIRQITQGITSLLSYSDTIPPSGSGTKESIITTIPEGIKRFILVQSSSGNMSMRATVTNLSAEIIVRDRNGAWKSVIQARNGSDHTIESIIVDRQAESITAAYTDVDGFRRLNSVPSLTTGFDLSGPLTLVGVFTRTTSNGSCVISLPSVTVGA